MQRKDAAWYDSKDDVPHRRFDRPTRELGTLQEREVLHEHEGCQRTVVGLVACEPSP